MRILETKMLCCLDEGVDWLTSLEHKMHKLKLIGLELMRFFNVTGRLMTRVKFPLNKYYREWIINEARDFPKVDVVF